jgi:hypothetical protein
VVQDPDVQATIQLSARRLWRSRTCLRRWLSAPTGDELATLAGRWTQPGPVNRWLGGGQAVESRTGANPPGEGFNVVRGGSEPPTFRFSEVLPPPGP